MIFSWFKADAMVYDGTMEKQLQQRGVLIADGPLGDNSVVVIGDVHGCADALLEILSQVYDTGCTLVFAGDLIDRGDDSDVVLQVVKAIQEKPRAFGLKAVHVVRGNHEQMALDAYKESLDEHAQGNPFRLAKGDYELWKQNGGSSQDFKFMTEAGMWPWLESLPLYYEHRRAVRWGHESKRLLVTHASVEAGFLLDEQDRDVLIWDRQVEGYHRDYITVHGHTICKDGRPTLYNTPTGQVLHIDTGSFFTGIVTAVTFEEDS